MTKDEESYQAFLLADEQRKAAGWTEQQRIDIVLAQLDQQHQEQIEADFKRRNKQLLRWILPILCIMGFGFLLYIW